MFISPKQLLDYTIQIYILTTTAILFPFRVMLFISWLFNVSYKFVEGFTNK